MIQKVSAKWRLGEHAGGSSCFPCSHTACLVFRTGYGQRQSIRLARFLVQLSYPFLLIIKKTLQKGLSLSFKNIFATNSLNLLKPRTEVVSFHIFWIPDQENKTKPNQTKTQSKTKQTKKTTRNKFSFIYIFHASIFGLFLSTTL